MGMGVVVAQSAARRRQDCAGRTPVRHVIGLNGDGLGYDALSVDASGKERFIEVKTTSYGKETPFFISRNEVEFSRANDAHFHFYRLFEFRKSPRLFDLAGPVERNCLLNPISYVGRFL